MSASGSSVPYLKSFTLAIAAILILTQRLTATEIGPLAFGVIERLDPRMDQLVPAEARPEVVAEGFVWIEGPVWDGRHHRLLFSDVPANTIYAWDEVSGAHVFMHPSGYSGDAPFPGREPGSNGLAIDNEGRLVICEHGDRRIERLEADGRKVEVVSRFQGYRLNSPNDLFIDDRGALYFTDPPFGLPQTFVDSERELAFSGVYRRLPEGEVSLLISDLRGPNGVALSPDGKTLYVSDASLTSPAWFAYPLGDDGSVGTRRVIYDASPLVRVRRGAPDGLKVDRQGNLFGAGPEGVYVFASDGTHLGTIGTGVPTGNVGWGEDGHTLFITAEHRLLRVRLTTGGRTH